ncbi:ABC transporter ATP-binding protein [Nonomuraea sp. NPDC050310]|uniref:ABC transporter ATP-binding protein n=1 Tax=unclassified Nonomuraea TaxID=2593643 RepID=UPI0033CAC02B
MDAPAPENGLRVRELSVSRGETGIVHEVSLAAPPGSVTVLLGANGAGKTTLLDGIAGLARAGAGEIELDGRRLTGLPTHRRAAAGLGYAEQARTVFRRLTLEQNLLVAGEDVAGAYRLFPELEARRHLPAGNLSGGEQQMLVLGRALIARPKALLVDELSLGLAPLVVRRLMNAVGELAAQGLAVLLVEQFAALALRLGERAYVLRKGRVVFDGRCADLRPELLHDHYFGTREAS